MSVDPRVIEKAVRWRHEIHKNPEMAFQERDTAALVADVLQEAGYSVTTGIAKTGVVGVKSFGDGPSIALRADMDALPIMEQNAFQYRSVNDGCMHACGHDGHTAMLLGAALSLADRKDLSGTLHLVFQPAEENEAGARAMIQDGILDRFSFKEIYGLHNMPGVPVGRFQTRAGAVLASFDKFDITISGNGGHGAFPHQASDAILAGSALTVALNSIVSRNVKPSDPAVVTVGHFAGMGAYNVIPGQVQLQGSCRSLSSETRDIIRSRIKDLCAGFATSYGLEIECDYQDGYPSVVNTDVNSQFIIEALQELVGAENVDTEFDPYLGSEDFAFFLEKVPGNYFILGNGDQSGAIHSDTYDFNDEALPFGISAWVKIAEKALGGTASSEIG